MKAVYEASTNLTFGARGVLDGAAFELVGRTCVRGPKGALWNEWVLQFEDRSLQFLAESGNGLTIFEEQPLVPALDALVMAEPLDAHGFIVVERGRATRVAHWGTVDRDAPASYSYADLCSRNGMSATIDYGAAGQDPRLFFGRKLTFADLGLTPRAPHPRLLPVAEVSRPKGVEPWLAIGDEGELNGTRFRVLGIVSRSLVEDDDRDDEVDDNNNDESNAWDEYLLHEVHAGFRWLVIADGHWSLVEPIAPGVVQEVNPLAILFGETYEQISEGVARVDWAAGELPWEIGIGDTSNVRDFVRVPWILTKEWSVNEVSWSRGAYLEVDAVAKAFGKRAFPKPAGRAPHQPPPPSKNGTKPK